MKKLNSIFVATASTTILAACGGGGTSSAPDVPRYLSTISVPNVSSTSTTFSYDAGQVVDGFLYLTDRNNRSVDIVEAKSLIFTGLVTGSGATAFTGDGKTPEDAGGKRAGGHGDFR